MAKDLVSDDSDDEDVEYKGHFCSGCSIHPPRGVRGWVRGYGGVGLWEAGSPGLPLPLVIRTERVLPRTPFNYMLDSDPLKY